MKKNINFLLNIYNCIYIKKNYIKMKILFILLSALLIIGTSAVYNYKLPQEYHTGAAEIIAGDSA
jgi:hypothetical protein